ncbi:MAG: helix-turn-helix transcriptional regulator [Leptospiraceae bacterium]|nr:helix-turn-helix transcriptional regulator [Leptospiraceae bacterium]
MKQVEFSEKFGIGNSTLSDIINGKIKYLPTELIFRLNKEYNISVDWLLYEKGNMIEVNSDKTLSMDEAGLISEVRENPKLLGILKEIVNTLKKNL